MENDVDGNVPSFTLLQIPGISNPESIDNWLQCKAKNDVDGPTRKSIAVNAKQHLASRDWKIQSCNEGTCQFISPVDHTVFSNLFDACLFESVRNWGKKDDDKNEDEKEMEKEEEMEEEMEEEKEDGGQDNSYIITCSLCNSATELQQFDATSGFCSESCRIFFSSIKEMLFNDIPVKDGINVVLMQVDRTKVRSEQDEKFHFAHEILKQCFGDDPMFENMIYSEGGLSGFYTSIVQNNGVVASIAMVRFHTRGDTRMVEIPFVGTDKYWQRKKMCRHLFNALERQFTQLGISEIVLPATKKRYEMWRDNFGFSHVSLQDLEHRFGGKLNIMQFYEVILCSKRL